MLYGLVKRDQTTGELVRPEGSAEVTAGSNGSLPVSKLVDGAEPPPPTKVGPND
jgi:hypothetical protein